MALTFVPVSIGSELAASIFGGGTPALFLAEVSFSLTDRLRGLAGTFGCVESGLAFFLVEVL